MQRISVVMLWLFAALPCLGLVIIDPVSKERAEKELGARIRTEPAGTNQVVVWLEFTARGALRDFGSIHLEITSPEGRLVSAILEPSQRKGETVAVHFSTTPAYLRLSTLTVFVRTGGWPEYGKGFQFHVKEFIEQEPPEAGVRK